MGSIKMDKTSFGFNAQCSLLLPLFLYTVLCMLYILAKNRNVYFQVKMIPVTGKWFCFLFGQYKYMQVNITRLYTQLRVVLLVLLTLLHTGGTDANGA